MRLVIISIGYYLRHNAHDMEKQSSTSLIISGSEFPYYEEQPQISSWSSFNGDKLILDSPKNREKTRRKDTN